jgi:4-amino-4-deoxy-L-arabinose transferase-like glycosyltransferase
MSNETTEIDSEEAKTALNSIRNLESIALQNAMPSTWFVFALALVVGLLVFLIGAGLRDYYVFPIIALPIIIAVQGSKIKASLRTIKTSRKTIIGLVSLIVFMLGLILIAFYIRAYFGTLVGPMVSGVVASLVVFWISLTARKELLNMTDKGART